MSPLLSNQSASEKSPADVDGTTPQTGLLRFDPLASSNRTGQLPICFRLLRCIGDDLLVLGRSVLPVLASELIKLVY